MQRIEKETPHKGKLSLVITKHQLVIALEGEDLAAFPITDIYNLITSELISHTYTDVPHQRAKLTAGIALHSAGMFGEIYESITKMVNLTYVDAKTREKNAQDQTDRTP